VKSQTKASEQVHDIRVAGKRARAILRLIEPDTGPTAKKLHDRIRQVSRQLTPARDGEIVATTIERLAKGDPKLVKATPRSIPFPASAELRRLSGELRRIGADIASLASAEATGPKMRKGLKKTFGRVRKLYGKCRKGGTPERFHEWRKRSKDLLYQIETLAPEPTRSERKWIACLKSLSDCLGEMHDLTVTLQLLSTRRSKVGKLKRRAKREYSKSAKKAVRLARRFFRSGPKADLFNSTFA
jgi:CHAD domain-containing protein